MMLMITTTKTEMRKEEEEDDDDEDEEGEGENEEGSAAGNGELGFKKESGEAQSGVTLASFPKWVVRAEQPPLA